MAYPMKARHPIMDKVLIIDFEASGLHGDSYPTEIAWIDPINDEKATSYLIRPATNWLNTKWCAKAEELTGISQKMLYKKGKLPKHVAIAALEALSKADVILSDAPEWDSEWMRVLLHAAGVNDAIVPFSELHGFIRREFDKDIHFEDESAHRAGKDVEQMAAAFNLASFYSKR
jgi:hypothetical protein